MAMVLTMAETAGGLQCGCSPYSVGNSRRFTVWLWCLQWREQQEVYSVAMVLTVELYTRCQLDDNNNQQLSRVRNINENACGK